MWIIWLSILGGLFFIGTVVMVILYMGAGVCEEEARVETEEPMYYPEDTTYTTAMSDTVISDHFIYCLS